MEELIIKADQAKYTAKTTSNIDYYFYNDC